VNERMRDPFHTLLWKASIGYNDSWSQVDPEVLEKFAELIVQECVDVADDYVKDCLCAEHKRCNHPRSKIGIKIKEHFGVEE